jgi:hypothetical protein
LRQGSRHPRSRAERSTAEIPVEARWRTADPHPWDQAIAQTNSYNDLRDAKTMIIMGGNAQSCRQPRPAGRQRDRYQYFKRLGLLRELVPGAVRVAVLVNPAYPDSEHMVRDVVAAARAMGLQIQVINASTSREINTAFASLVRERRFRPACRGVYREPKRGCNDDEARRGVHVT